MVMYMLKSTEAFVTIFAPKRLDALTSPHLAQDLEFKIQDGRTIVIDLSKTQSIDPQSAEVVLQGLLLAKRRSARFSLRGVNSQVRMVLEMAGVLQHFRQA